MKAKKYVSLFAGIILIVCLVSANVFAGSTSISTTLLGAGVNNTIKTWQTKTNNTDGSYVTFSLTTYAGATLWTDAIVSGTQFQFSPPTYFTSGSNRWLGAYTYRNASTGDSIRLRGTSGGFADDTISGTWNFN